MSRKIFLSVLGSGQYGPCKYVLPDGSYNSGEVKYVQEAMLKLLQHEMGPSDQVYIFLTEGPEGSRQKNWEDDGWIERSTQKPLQNEGLASRIQKLNFPCEVTPVGIPDGNNEKEIWDVFSKMFEVIDEDDHIYFDVTHGFRYLPMLGLVLLNYAKFLKNVTVEKITYGNFDGRDKAKNEAPIVDLTSFSLLQDWTSAASEFLNNGNATSIEALAIQQVRPVLAKSLGKDIDAANIRDFAKSLNKFSNQIITGRSKSIYSGAQVQNIRDRAENVKEDLIAPMAPIVEKTKEKVVGFKPEGNVENGYAAVNWCVDNNLIQQAYSLLLETTISAVLEKLGKKDFFERDAREIVSSAFYIHANKIPFNKWIKLCQENSDFVNALLENSFFQKLSSAYSKLSTYRNDLLHAGTKKESIDSEDAFRRNIEKYRDEIIQIYREEK